MTEKLKQSNKRTRGSVRAKAGLSAKAGKRHLAVSGKPTTPEARAEAASMHRIQSRPKAKPIDQIRVKMTGTQPELEKMFWAAAAKA